MKKGFYAVLIFGWFFAWRTPTEIEGAFDVTVSGPYQTEGICKEQLETVKEMAEVLGLKDVAVFTKCQYKQEA